MTARIPVLRPIDVVVNSAGPWSTVRVEQPFRAMQQHGWDVCFVATPFDPVLQIRDSALVIWQRPLPESVEQWRSVVEGWRRRGCLVLVEWDDHPDLFRLAIREQCKAVDHIHLRCCHGVQTSNPLLAEVLRRFNPHVFELENGVQPIPSLRHEQSQPSARVFLGNFNREQEQRQLAPALKRWFHESEAPQLVTVGPSGLEGLLPPERLESHAPLAYPDYRELLASCQVALLPLQCGEPQACKTPIKWLEAAAESVAVVAGPELYKPWLEQGRYGLFASELSAMVPLARQLVEHPQQRMELVERAHARSHDFQLERLLPWRMALYRHLNRLAQPLERALGRRFPIRQGV
ncbi:hypothetical protein [Synechococcus sp. A15-60]|uniref:glycosyltransferase family protein n=1 Tax=Synechococcus sp. A15-60 TaxID=1050655 RepID=UPI001644D185|nr:hypothetical protein [Synechococcus sp. A15-60]QNI46820.1 methyltransferase domain protein [Synechococcus sp. A15-60]